MKKHIILLPLLLLAGCTTYKLEELRQVKPDGTPFQKALYEYYKNFAEKEEQQYDWVDSAHFADKGLQAAYGKEVLPEDPSQWNIDATTLPVMQTGYQTLMEVLKGGAAETHPELAARAQYYFDCWVEQQEEGWQEADIAYCRDGFTDAMDLLLAGGEPKAEDEKQEAVTEDTADNGPGFILPARPQVHSYIVFFKEKEAVLSASGQEAIADVIEKAKDGGDYQFVLNAHTDTVGEAEDNLKLTEARAQAVRQVLIEGGVDADKIRHFAFGESDTPVKTADNIDEPANQRVEIFLSE